MPATSPLVLVIRHGRTALNDPSNPKLRAWEDPPIDKRGILDAKVAAQQIRQFRPQIVYSSDLTRDAMTAQIVAQELGNIPQEVDHALRTADMGELSGEAEKDVVDLVQKWYMEPWWPAPSGESLNQFLSRFYPAFDLKFNLAKDVEGFRPSVIVTHGRNCAAIYARAFMVPQGNSLMPFPGGVMSVFLDERGEIKTEFLGESEPILNDV